MGWYMGVDVGAFTCKVALLDDERVVGWALVPSGTDYARNCLDTMARLLKTHDVAVEAVCSVVATGVGARSIGFADAFVGDVVCTARGTAAVAPSVGTVIDIGAQATRVIWLDEQGRVANFTANEKCATGSGRFLQVVANVLRVNLEEVGPMSLRSANPVRFTTGCAVFGESEAITRVSEGVSPEDILAGVHRALAEKIATLLGSRGIQGECGVCGGGALDVGLLRQIEQALGRAVLVVEPSQMVGAIGAGIQARRLTPAEGETVAARWLAQETAWSRASELRDAPPDRPEAPSTSASDRRGLGTNPWSDDESTTQDKRGETR